jgi:hypothetical protein
MYGLIALHWHELYFHHYMYLLDLTDHPRQAGQPRDRMRIADRRLAVAPWKL